MPKGVYKRTKPAWNKGLKKADHPSISKMGFQKGHAPSFNPNSRAYVLNNLFYRIPKGTEPWNKGKSGYYWVSGEEHGNWKGGNGGYHDTAKWKTFRKEIFVRDNYTCRGCSKRSGNGRKTELNVHHILPAAYFPDRIYDKDNCITLCIECHKMTDSYGSKCITNYAHFAKKSEELLGTPERTISSRAKQECLEGSETNVYAPEWSMKRHEHPTPKGEDIVRAAQECADIQFKRLSDNKLNGTDYTQKIETLSEFNIRNNLEKGLVVDQKDVIDSEIHAKMTSAEFKAVCSATNTTVFTTNGTATIVASSNPSDINIRRIVEYMKNTHIPKLGTHYVGILSVNAMGGVYDYLQAIAQYAEPSFRFKDEVGRYYGVRFVEDNAQASNVIGNGSVLGEGVVFGEEFIAEALALPVELRYEETDVGRTKTLAWYGIMQWKKIWSLSADDTNSTGKGIERAIHITSA